MALTDLIIEAKEKEIELYKKPLDQLSELVYKMIKDKETGNHEIAYVLPFTVYGKTLKISFAQ